jgi:NAD(P)-dependent dehydrogenase (short-subunit alcohol dehydrogenase family)
MPTVLVTGANRGIGLEFVRQYAVDGWDVIATAREVEAGSELNILGVRVEQLDMRDLERVVELGEAIDGELDLLIANAGTSTPVNSDTAEDGRQWADMLVTNCIAPCLLAKTLAPKIVKPGGKLIALSSGMGSIGEASSPGYIPYRTSKAALNMAWRALAIELRPRGLITAAFDPGWVKTRMGGPNARLTPQESVAAMRALISRLGPEHSGGYFRRSGEPIPW